MPATFLRILPTFAAMRSALLVILLYLWSATWACSLAAADYLDQLVSRANADNLAFSRAWLALGHYKPGGLLNDWTSQADDLAFFLSPHGKHDPKLELEATIRAFGLPVQNADRHAQCRFPARYHWLIGKLGIDPKHLLQVNCEELNTWFDTLRPGSLTLVFPAAYINSPSSMFGHTLLRVNPNDHRRDSPLVAYALNYAANANAGDNALMFSIKGLIGGYPGVFSIVPYYDKIREYRDLENRDIWEYDLDFSLDEVRQLMRHAWEVRHIRFDYYFFTENCSYHMLSLMEVARPELDLTSRFEVKAIPSDTVRGVFEAGLVGQVRYRPSSTTVLSQHAQQLGDDNSKVLAIIGGELDVDAVAGLPPLRQARIYEQAYDYARFLATANPGVTDKRASTNWRLLSARSKLKLDEVWQPIARPEVRTEQGHATSRLALGAGSIDGSDYLSVKLRPAYHDQLDPVAGYTPGAQINFFDIDLRYYRDEDELRLNKLTLIDVLSLTPRDDYFSPISWRAEFALQDRPALHGPLHATQLILNGGFSYQPFSDFTLSALGELDLRAASDYVKGYSAGAGVKLSLLTQRDKWSLQLSVAATSLNNGERNDHRLSSLQLAFHSSVSDSWRLSMQRSKDYGVGVNDIQLSWHHYY